MKKTIIAVAALIMTFGFTSCKKDYMCVCKLNGTTISTTQYSGVTRAEAEDRCDGDATVGAITYDCDVELD